jgi:hypothetical protein
MDFRGFLGSGISILYRFGSISSIITLAQI